MQLAIVRALHVCISLFGLFANLIVVVYSIVLERLISIDQNSTEQQLTDHEPSDPTQSSVYPSLARESEPGPTRAAPWMGTAPYAESDDLSEAAIAPAFVGDEEILPGKRYRPPVPSLYDGE